MRRYGKIENMFHRYQRWRCLGINPAKKTLSHKEIVKVFKKNENPTHNIQQTLGKNESPKH